MSLKLDQEGWSDAARLLDQMSAALQQLQTDSAARTSARQPGRPMIDAESALLHFRHSPRST